jgi:hypothetical protein
MTDQASRAKARAERMTLRKMRLGEPEADLSPVFGSEAVSLVSKLTRLSYGLANRPAPTYSRAAMPWKFVPWPRGD